MIPPSYNITHRLGGETLLRVFFDTFPGPKMRKHLLTGPGVLVILVVTHPNTIQPQRFLTSVIEWVPVRTTWQRTVLYNATFYHPVQSYIFLHLPRSDFHT
jgi:hypothetical protein